MTTTQDLERRVQQLEFQFQRLLQLLTPEQREQLQAADEATGAADVSGIQL